MSLLATDFEESYLSTEVGSICPEVQFDWIAEVIDGCPLEFHNAMADAIIQAFFKSPIDMFEDIFGPTIAHIIYKMGHMLRLRQKECFIERRCISFRKQEPFGNAHPFKCAIHIELGTEEVARLLLVTDIVPNWPTNGERISVKNPYYVDTE